jgi:hypothetical protein
MRSKIDGFFLAFPGDVVFALTPLSLLKMAGRTKKARRKRNDIIESKSIVDPLLSIGIIYRYDLPVSYFY